MFSYSATSWVPYWIKTTQSGRKTNCRVRLWNLGRECRSDLDAWPPAHWRKRQVPDRQARAWASSLCHKCWCSGWGYVFLHGWRSKNICWPPCWWWVYIYIDECVQRCQLSLILQKNPWKKQNLSRFQLKKSSWLWKLFPYDVVCNSKYFPDCCTKSPWFQNENVGSTVCCVVQAFNIPTSLLQNQIVREKLQLTFL